MTTFHETVAQMKCPTCGGPMELVWQGTGSWRVSCMKNDLLDDDEPAACAQPDAWGATEEAAIKAALDGGGQ